MWLMAMAFHVRGGLFGFVCGILLGYSLKCSVRGFARAFRSGGHFIRVPVQAFRFKRSGAGVRELAFGQAFSAYNDECSEELTKFAIL